jgi:4-alpha-glucanotransferase
MLFLSHYSEVTTLPSPKRASGILLHISSLPSPYGIGDLGPWSYRFVDLLANNNQRVWSILPLSPTRLEDGNSPYQTSSAYAGNPLLISPQKLAQDGLLPKTPKATAKSGHRVDYKDVYACKKAVLKDAYLHFKETGCQKRVFEAFCIQNEGWLGDYALYAALRESTGVFWYQWLPSLRRRDPKALEQKQRQLNPEVELEKFAQYLFFSQWRSLKEYCNKKAVSVVGDMPFYVAYDSADIWVHPELFRISKNGNPRYVGGVPPDYFSATGQLWGNPVYDWQKHEKTGFEWWIARIKHNLMLFDRLRLDHFRGFVACWQVSSRAKTAVKGRWVKTPSAAFFGKLRGAFPSLPFIAEDLGYIDNPVRQAIRKLGVPGMRVLLFGLDGARGNPHTPSNYVENAVVYTGTHDTNTVRGWFTGEASAKEKANLFRLIGREVPEKTVSFQAVKLAEASVADLCLVPLQDVLGLGAEARMNCPSQSFGNWEWRVTEAQLKSEWLRQFGEVTVESSR